MDTSMMTRLKELGCYRHQLKLSEKNEAIADWLIRITDSQRYWGFNLCFLYLSDVKNFRFNHKRVYRINCVLSLNMWMKPEKRLKWDTLEPLTAPEISNECWVMDLMHDQVLDGRSAHLLNVIDDFNREAINHWGGFSPPGLSGCESIGATHHVERKSSFHMMW